MRGRMLRWRGLRRPWVYWSVVAIAAATTSLVVASMVAEGQRRVEAWEPTGPVAVAARELVPGTALTEEDLRWESRPRVALPAGTVDRATNVVGRVVIARMFPGEAVLRSRLGPDGLAGLTALVPPGSAAIVLPGSTRPPRVQLGDAVDLYAAPGPARSVEGAGEVVAKHALVIDTAPDGAITVAIHQGEVAQVTPLLLDGSLVVALVPPP